MADIACRFEFGCMQVLEPGATCPECNVSLIDALDEMVCPGCGITKDKEVLENGVEVQMKVPRFGSYVLGSFMGAKRKVGEASSRKFRGLDGSGFRYGYFKAVSDRAGKEEGAQVDCAKIIERVGELLLLPRLTIVEATAMARKVLAHTRSSRRITAASVSAHCLISACKIGGVCSVDSKEIIKAHAPFGRVTTSSVMRVAFDSPIRTFTRSPVDYVAQVIGRLSMNPRLAKLLAADGAPIAPFLRALTETSMEVLANLEEGSKWGRRPTILAASAVYAAERTLALREKRKPRISQRDLAECVGSSEYTIREQFSSCFGGMPMALAREGRPSHLPAD